MKIFIGWFSRSVSIIFLFFITGAYCANAQVCQQWVARYDGAQSTGDSGVDIVVDPDGNIYVTGSATWENQYSDYSTIKYDPLGIPLWIARYDGPSHNSDQPEAMVIDEDRNIYVTGRSKDDASDWDYLTVKYDTDGNELWTARYNGTGNDWDRAFAIAVDPSGNVFVTGYSENLDDKDFVTVKYDSSGRQQWVDRYNGPGYDDDEGYAITTDTEGYAYVTGWSKELNPTCDYLTIKFDPMGNREWIAHYNGTGNWYDHARTIAVDQEGNVYVSGGSTGESGASQDYTTIKYSPDGDEFWVARYDGIVSDLDAVTAMILDENGNVYVTGQSMGYGEGYSYDHVTIKYDNDGNQQWLARYNGPGNYWDEAYDLVLDNEGNVYTTGFCTGGWTGWDYVTLKYNSAGVQQWVICYDGPDYGWGDDIASAMAIDTEGNVIITGYSDGYNTNNDFATIKYSQGDNPYFELSLIPFVTPIEIPASGGSFEFYLSADNNTSTAQVVNLWIEAVLEGGFLHPILLGPAEVNLNPGNNIYHHTQVVPETAPSGLYHYVAYIGIHPGVTWDCDSLQIFKMSATDGQPAPDEVTWNDPFQENLNEAVQNSPADEIQASVYPAPFNSSAMILFDLPDAAQVELTLYDLQGRAVVTPYKGWLNSGNHNLAIDGSQLSSGIYIYRLSTADFKTEGKMVLLK